MKRPRMAKPSVSRAARAVGDVVCARAQRRRKRRSVIGPTPPSRPRKISTSASSGDQVALRIGCRRGDRRMDFRVRPQRLELRHPLGGNPYCHRMARRQPGRAFLAGELAKHSIQPGVRCASSAEKAEPQQRVVQFVGVGRIGPGLARTRAIASGSSRPRSVGRLRRQPAAAITAWVRRSSNGASSR